MPRETQREKLLERYQPDQPALFDAEGLPTATGVLAAVETRSYEHTGARLLEDEERALKLVQCVLAGWGIRKIAREMGISPMTIRAARRALVAQGKLGTYEERIAAAMEDAIEANIMAYRDAAENGAIAPSQIPVPTAVLFDKRQLLVGRPTSITGVIHTRAREFSVEAINASFETIPEPKVETNPAPKDSASVVDLKKAQQMQGEAEPGAILGTTPSPTGDPARDGGGGGVGTGRGRATESKRF